MRSSRLPGKGPFRYAGRPAFGASPWIGYNERKRSDAIVVGTTGRAGRDILARKTVGDWQLSVLSRSERDVLQSWLSASNDGDGS